MELNNFNDKVNINNNESMNKFDLRDVEFDPDVVLDDNIDNNVNMNNYDLNDAEFDPDAKLDNIENNVNMSKFDLGNIEFNPNKRLELDMFKGTPLTEEDRTKLKEETQWSNEIINSIQTKEEAEVLKNAKVHEEEINEKKCLVRDDIDMNQVDGDGLTNRQRMESGKAPIDKDGNKIELHHIGQRKDSPLAELNSIEHDHIPNPKKNSEVHKDEYVWKKEKENHWKTRVEE